MALRVPPSLKWTIPHLPAKFALATIVLAWVLFLHLAGLSLFTRGFLLTRLALDSISTCPSDSATLCDLKLPPTHRKAIILIIDALRFDFVSPNPPTPLSPYHHHIITLPSELSSLHTLNSFLFHSYADPPTATLQRIKGITTGSLPTFVDLGSSFSGTAISEDSLLLQLRREGKRVGFMGDDTWTSVFPKSFEVNMSFPYDSFNVEDLHSVDEGVIRHLFPLLQKEHQASWDVLIGHFLGVDHVGHRVGPNHPTMKLKQQQMDTVLRRVVQEMDDDTLLVLLGDHGMDSKGDHGGDGDLETSAAMWIYTKGPALSTPEGLSSQLGVTPHYTFPGSPVSHRTIQQIDLVPTLSLLLGLPIPFNNLGTLIPELFIRRDDANHLANALRINARQIWNYLEAYRTSPAGGELDAVWSTLDTSWKATLADGTSESTDQVIQRLFSFTRMALAECRALWAQFNVVLMTAGLVILALSLPTLWVVYSAMQTQKHWSAVGQAVIIYGWGGVLVGFLPGILCSLLFKLPISPLDASIASSAFTSEIAILSIGFVEATRSISRSMDSTPIVFVRSHLPTIVLFLHSIGFTSNSFTMWEDRLVLYLSLTLLAPIFLEAFSAPTPRLRNRLLFFTIVLMVSLRAMSISTICREEQQPFCRVTFYASSTRQMPPVLMLLSTLPVALLLPYIVRSFLAMSRSDRGAAPLFLNVLWRIILVGGSAYWLLEWFEITYGGEADSATAEVGRQALWVPAVLLSRTMVARVTMTIALVGGYAVWWYSPLCIEVQPQESAPGTSESSSNEPTKTNRLVIIGFANTYGSSYLIFVLVFFGILFIATQVTGQIVLGLTLVSILSYSEIVDSQRDVKALISNRSAAKHPELNVISPQSPQFAEPATLALISLITFFATGHQSVLSSIQWKTAFIGFPTLTYPFSPILVALNTFGPLVLLTISLPLFALWNVSPTMNGTVNVLQDSMKLAVGSMIYWTALALGTAGSAAILRRHLMVWKVFAPRFMLGGVSLILVDLALLLGVGIGVSRVHFKVNKVFGTSV
jgi:phosphatidylinositol glycan class O